MSEFDALIEDPTPPSTEIRNLTREQAVQCGRRMGGDESNRRGEIGRLRTERIARAEAYAGWDYDGRPAKGQPRYVKPVRFKPDPK